MEIIIYRRIIVCEFQAPSRVPQSKPLNPQVKELQQWLGKLLAMTESLATTDDLGLRPRWPHAG